MESKTRNNVTFQMQGQFQDSIGSEYFENEERSVMEKIEGYRTQEFNPKCDNERNSLAEYPHFTSNGDGVLKTTSSLLHGNESTDILSNQYSKTLSYDNNPTSSNQLKEEVAGKDKKNALVLLQTVEHEVLDLTRRYEKVKKLFLEKKKLLNQNKSQYEKIKLVNIVMKKLVISKIKEIN